MKKELLFVLILSMAGIASCNDKEDFGSVSPVSNVVAIPNIGTVTLTWTNPPETDYYYTLITFQNAKGETVTEKVSRYSDDESDNQSSVVIKGFEDTNTYTFTLIAYNTQGAASTPVTVSAAPQDANSAYLYIVNTITTSSFFQGGWVKWVNDYGVNVYVNVSFKDGQGNVQTKRVLSSKEDSVLISGFVDETVINVNIENSKGEVSDTKQVSIIPEIGELDQKQMSIHSISSVWLEQFAGEKMLDGDITSFWHSTLTEFPHWVVFDLGENFIVNWLELVRRPYDKGNGYSAPSKISWQYSLDGINFTDIGTYDFDVELVFNHTYNLKPAIYARYIKLNCLEGSLGWTHMAEFLAYYAEVADHYAKEAEEELIPPEPDPDDDDYIDPNVEYLTFNMNTVNDLEITQSPENMYEYTIKTTGSDPYVVINSLQKEVEGTVLVFHFQLSEMITAEFFWCDKGSGAVGGRETFFDVYQTTEKWNTFKKNFKQEMIDHNWNGNVGDYMRLDLGNSSGVNIKIRNIHFRAAREDE